MWRLSRKYEDGLFGKILCFDTEGISISVRHQETINILVEVEGTFP